jgi:hypothetical protein
VATAAKWGRKDNEDKCDANDMFPSPDSPRSSRCHPVDELGHPSARVEKGASELPPSKFVQAQKIAGLRLCLFVPVCAGLCRFVSQFHVFAGEQIARPLFLTVEKSWKK